MAAVHAAEKRYVALRVVFVLTVYRSDSTSTAIFKLAARAMTGAVAAGGPCCWQQYDVSRLIRETSCRSRLRVLRSESRPPFDPTLY
jgi:hypothetical protein